MAFQYELVGNRLSIDFTNTVNSRGTEEPIERLHEYGDLVSWAAQAGLVRPIEARRLLAKADRNRREARGVFNRALLMREAIYHLLAHAKTREQLRGPDLERLNTELARGMSRLQVIRLESGGFELSWPKSLSELDRVLWPVAQDAADFLVGLEPNRLKICGNDTCGWYFYDDSRNRSRRWCDTTVCGNRIRVRRYFARRRGQAAELAKSGPRSSPPRGRTRATSRRSSRLTRQGLSPVS